MQRALARLRSFVFSTFVLGLATMPPAYAAVDYTDIWWNAAESGWGVNLIQSNDFIFATFFIYGSNKQPKWVSAELTRIAGSSFFSGPVYSTEGTQFSLPWSPQNTKVTKVGENAIFAANDSGSGKLTYSIGGLEVSKAITRQTLTPIPIEGTYFAAMLYSVAGCADANVNGKYVFPLRMIVTRTADSTSFAFGEDGNVVFSGKIVQNGSHMAMPVTSWVDPNADPPINAPARGDQIKRTDVGIEGTFTSLLQDGCVTTLSFSAVAEAP